MRHAFWCNLVTWSVKWRREISHLRFCLNGAETKCGIAHILGILLINSCNTDIFFSNYYHLQSVRFELRVQFSKYFILRLYMKTIRARQAKVHSTYFVQRAQHGIIAKPLGQRKVLF